MTMYLMKIKMELMTISVMRMMTISCWAWVVANTVSKTEARVSSALRKDFWSFCCQNLCLSA